MLGDRNNIRQSYGPEHYDRPQRVVANFTYDLPGPTVRTSLRGELLGGWSLSGVVTIQAGHFLTPTYFNGNSVYGILLDRASLTGSCTRSQYVTSGGVSSHLTTTSMRAASLPRRSSVPTTPPRRGLVMLAPGYSTDPARITGTWPFTSSFHCAGRAKVPILNSDRNSLIPSTTRNSRIQIPILETRLLARSRTRA